MKGKFLNAFPAILPNLIGKLKESASYIV